ncbi:terminal nucleotidyltransferase 5C-like [Stigmatopora argus]
MTEPRGEKRFRNLTPEQVGALDKVLTEVISIHGRGNFPTLRVSAKDIIRAVRDRLAERNVRVKDVRLNGAAASHVLVSDNGLGARDLDIVFGVDLPGQDDFQVIKEVVLGSLRDLLPCEVNRRKITCLTMKEAYVQKMVKVFNQHDRWSLISLSNDKAKTVGLRFVGALRRQFQFSVDSFQIVLDRMLESYRENHGRAGKWTPSSGARELTGEDVEGGNPDRGIRPERASAGGTGRQDRSPEEETPARAEMEKSEGREEPLPEGRHEEPSEIQMDRALPKAPPVLPSSSTGVALKLQVGDEASHSRVSVAAVTDQSPAQDCVRAEGAPESHRQLFPSPPPAKKTCSTSPEVVPDYCPSPKLQRKMSRKLIRADSEKRSLPTDVSDSAARASATMEAPTRVMSSSRRGSVTAYGETSGFGAGTGLGAGTGFGEGSGFGPGRAGHESQAPTEPRYSDCDGGGPASEEAAAPVEASPPSPWVSVRAECTYGDFEQATEHLRGRLIATHHPEEIRGGGLLKYCELLVRDFRPASETEIKSVERYMCSRFFIDFPDVKEQRREVEAHLHGHLTGGAESGKYRYLMTLRRVVDESTVCLMGHERRQTLNMITVLALRILGEQNAIPNAANVTCFYQPAPYVSEPLYGGYFVAQPPPPSLLYQPYPLHVHVQSGPA